MAIIYFVCDHDPSGHDLRRAWEEALRNFNVIGSVVRIGLTMDQFQNNTDSRGQSLEGLVIQVKSTDSRSDKYIAEYGRRCWECDILPANMIEQAIDNAWRRVRLAYSRYQDVGRDACGIAPALCIDSDGG